MADLKKSVDEMTDAAKGFADFDPMASVRKEVDSFTSDPLGTASTESSGTPTPSAESASPEAAAPSNPAPVSPDAVIPQPSSDTPIPAEAPQPKAGSGA